MGGSVRRLFALACVGAALATTADFAGAQALSRWAFVRGGSKTRCARGSDFGFWVRRASPRHLLLYFQPGGGCFSYATCKPGSDWFDDRVDLGDSPTRLDGIFNLQSAENPFRDWSIVFIPSCTGDVHIGGRTTTYRSAAGRAVTIHHFGWRNSERALTWTYAHFPRPATVFMAGSSAGSVGSALHAPEVIEHYPRAMIGQLGDSLAFVFDQPLSLRDYAGLDHLPRWMRSRPDVRPGRFRMTSFMAHLINHYPQVRFARFNYADDAVQERFYVGVGGNPHKFHDALKNAEASLASRAPTYRSYTACGTAHIALSVPAFFTLSTKGVALKTWVAALSDHRDVASVSC